MAAPAVARAGGPVGKIRAVAFDALGTLFDTAAIEDEAVRLFPGRGRLLSQLWRLKQLEYTWLVSAADAYVPLSTLSLQALDYAAAQAGVRLTPEAVAQLMSHYGALPAFPDVKPALDRLDPALPMAILSASGASLLQGLVAKAGLQARLKVLISTDPDKVYKPSPRAYALLVKALQIPPEQILFVSSNGFDVWAAARFGLRTALLQRSGAKGAAPGDTLDVGGLYALLRGNLEGLEPKPDHVITSMAQLADLI